MPGYIVMSRDSINRSTKKKQAKKPGWREAEAEYQQWLMKHGAGKSQKKKITARGVRSTEWFVCP